MYEEEDDDLPLPYRHLTAHLQTGSTVFNRRLAAYLTHQVAMRSAMDQMMQQSYGQYANGPYQQNPNMFPSPMMPSQDMGHPLSSYRSVPYPSPHHPGFRPDHGRAFSMASMSNDQGPTSPNASVRPASLDQRRMSTSNSTQTGNIKSESPDESRRAQSTNYAHAGANFPPMWQDMSLFTTSLPPESQQMLAHAPGFDYNDPSYARLMQGADQYVSNPYYPWHDMQGSSKGLPIHPSAYQGMSATLAPAALEVESKTNTTTTSTPGLSDANPTLPSTRTSSDANTHTNNANSNAFSTAGPVLFQDNKNYDFAGGGGLGSDEMPAGEGFWDNFVIDSSWEGDEGSAPKSSGGGSITELDGIGSAG